MIIYRLRVEDLTHLGGPMGTEYTTTIREDYFRHKPDAIATALSRDTRLPKRWSGKYIDLLDRGYVIEAVRVHDQKLVNRGR